MNFNVNHPALYALTCAVVALVIGQSVFFLRKALRRAKEIGIEQEKIRKVIRTAAVFTIAPALAIVIGVMTLSKDLGIPLPWLRLSVVGSLSYETIAASNALRAMGRTFGAGGQVTAQQYVTVLFVMTISILGGITLLAFIGRSLQRGMERRTQRDRKWSELFTNAMFIGMITAFVGFIFSDVSCVTRGETYGLIPVFVFLIAMAATAVCGLLMKKKGWNWLGDYALPFALLIGMASAIPLTALLG